MTEMLTSRRLVIAVQGVADVANSTVAMASAYLKASVKRPALKSLQAYKILKV